MAIATLTHTNPGLRPVSTGDSGAFVIPALDQVRALADDELLGLLGQLDEASRRIATAKARVAGEITRRSAFSAGHAGLAARFGERTPEKLIQRLTGVSAGEARELTSAGALLRAVEDGAAPWLQSVATAVQDGALSVVGAAAVAKGLGEPSTAVTEAALVDATTHLVEFAKTATPEEAISRARAVRDEIDSTGVADRERILRGRRSFTWKTLPNGLIRGVIVLDPESGAIILPAITAAVRVAKTKGDVRFMTQDERDTAVLSAGAFADGGELGAVKVRTVDQAQLDALVDIVQLGTRAATSELDPQRIFGGNAPGVRVHVQAADLESGTGAGYFEGHTAAVSIETVTRLICSSGILPVLFSGQQPIDAGRTQRLHSVRQRIALAAAWGGCTWSGCDQPEHACEVHHRERWNGSNTTLEQGIPFCRFHHVELHTNGWSLSRDADGTIWLEPPPGLPMIGRRALRSKSPLQRSA